MGGGGRPRTFLLPSPELWTDQRPRGCLPQGGVIVPLGAQRRGRGTGISAVEAPEPMLGHGDTGPAESS